MQTCQNCGTMAHDESAKFCSKCGTRYSEEGKPVAVCLSAGTGDYEITFPPQVVHQPSEECAREVASASSFGEDGEFTGEVKVRLLRSSVPVDLYPFECVVCASSQCGTVSNSDEIKCEYCDLQNWRLREVGTKPAQIFSSIPKARVLSLIEENIADMPWPTTVLVMALFYGLGDTVAESLLRAAIQVKAVQIAHNEHFAFAETSKRISAEINELTDGKAKVTVAYGGAQARSIEIVW